MNPFIFECYNVLIDYFWFKSLIFRCVIFYFYLFVGITQEYYELFLTNPGSSIPQNSSYTAIYLHSHKSSK